MSAKKQAGDIEAIEKDTKIKKSKTGLRLRSLVSTKKRKIITILSAMLLLLVLIFAIPTTRYFVSSSFIKKEVTITIIDASTKRPVSNATIALGNNVTQSDKNGVVKIQSVPVGEQTLKVSKQYYTDSQQSYTVPILSKPNSLTIEIIATGRQVLVSVMNKISGAPLSDVVISSSDTKATTNSEGTATIILPPKNVSQKATLVRTGYNSLDVELRVDGVTNNINAMTPSGSIYFLSKATGNINVVKSNIDGTNATIAVAATGQEGDDETSLLSSRDWQYSALLATRTDNKQRLYLIDATKGDFVVMDEGNATFELVGWSGHNFIYMVYRNTGNSWDDKRQVLKSFDAETRKITVLDTTAGSGTSVYDNAYEVMTSVYILKDELVYLKYWSLGSYTREDANRVTSLYSISPTGGSKKTVKTFPNNSTNLKLYEPQGIYIRVYSYNNPSTFYEYENKSIKSVDTNDNQFNSFYPTFLVSPSGNKTLWYEPRDGKNTILIGNLEGKESKVIGTLSEYTPYGWYGENDQYILLTKKGSELYIADASRVIGENGYTPLKVTDYHKTRSFAGYGYGYGGQ